MRPALITVTCCVVGAAGCGTATKYIDPRSDLDRKIYYVERDKNNSPHPISSAKYSGEDQLVVERVPLPAAVDINSTIQIRMAKGGRPEENASGALSKESEAVEKTKKTLTEALKQLTGVIEATTKFLQAYDRRKTNPEAFFSARQTRDGLEAAMRRKLDTLWDHASDTYRAYDTAYDPPRFEKLQAFLHEQLTALEGPNRRIESELADRKRRLIMEAFLISPGKDAAAIHLDGYDTIKAESLERRDTLGLDLSPLERARLEAQVKATEDLARTLERLRRGEATLNETVDRVKGELTPELESLLTDAQSLSRRFNKAALTNKKAETEKLLADFLAVLKSSNQNLVEKQEAAARKEEEDLLSKGLVEIEKVRTQVDALLNAARNLKSSPEKGASGASDVVTLILGARSLPAEFEKLRKDLPGIAKEIEVRVSRFVDDAVKDLKENESAVLKSPEASKLRANLQQYVQDVQDAQAFVVRTGVVLGALGQPSVPEMPATTAGVLEVPLDKIKDTFIDLEQTPRLVGDGITVRATLKDGDNVVDNSVARFRVERFGHYAELSPAVVLAKPRQIAGTDTGFRFAPTLSWLAHKGPRLEETDWWSNFVRMFDPSLGIHSAFLNFSSPTSDSSAQIGLGVTLALWKNRLQFGYGYNLMAKSVDEGRYYFFIGSDLIGLLQAMGIAK